MKETLSSDLEVCAWQDDENGASHTDCGGIWECYDSTPPENGMKYCPYCGKLMAWCSYSEPEDDDEEEDTDPYEAAGESRFGLPGGGKSL